MSRLHHRVGLSGVALLSLLAACGASEATPGGARVSVAPKPPAIGAAAPALTLTDLDERSVSLAALRDTVVVLNIWATWCQPCRLETPELVTLSGSSRDSR